MIWLRMQRIGRRCLSLSVARRGDASESGYHGRDDWRYTPTEDELYKMSQKEYLDKLKGLVKKISDLSKFDGMIRLIISGPRSFVIFRTSNSPELFFLKSLKSTKVEIQFYTR